MTVSTCNSDYWSPERVRARRVERLLGWLLLDEPGQGLYRADRAAALAEIVLQACERLRLEYRDAEVINALRRLIARIEAGERLSA